MEHLNPDLLANVNILDNPFFDFESAASWPAAQLDPAPQTDTNRTAPGFDIHLFMSSLTNPNLHHTAPVDTQTNILYYTTPTPSLEDGRPSQTARPRSKRKTVNIYSCTECNVVASSRRSLGNHIKDAHNMKAFKCPYCDIRVTRHDNLESHKRSCKSQPPPHNSAAAPGNGRPRKARGPRVSIRDINLQPEPMRPLPLLSPAQPTSPVPPPPPPQPHIVSQSSNRGTPRSTADPALELQTIKRQLAEFKAKCEHLEWEVSHWKKNCFNSREKSHLGGIYPH
ncbi:hypothetical protein TWF718_010903 [Orbilia javanica]|uniref:C2H2-type domain-containing protein n=1 Tax=Orbilia javanica TaxID=47235 RepID=A0AAN8MGI9_9PEZI